MGSIKYVKTVFLWMLFILAGIYSSSCNKKEISVKAPSQTEQTVEVSTITDDTKAKIDEIKDKFPNICLVDFCDTIYISDLQNNYLYRIDIHSKEKILVDNTLKVSELSIKDNKLYYVDTDRHIEKVISLDEKTGKPKDDRVTDIYEKMSLEDKIGQLFIVAFRKDMQGNGIEELDKEIKMMIGKYNFGGIILFSENINSNAQTKKLIEDIQLISKVPSFIAIDEEGGKVSRLTHSPNMKATKLPGNGAIGKSGNTQNAYDTAKIIANELTELGFNLNFAPVADINTNPNNPVIGDRSFGSDPEMVAAMTAAMTRGFQENGVSATLKHFPGHGDTSFDTHTGAVSVSHDLERLRQVELIPFESGIQEGADAIMTAHIQVPNVTGDNVPSTFSHYMLTEILRKELGFKKLIITDSLEMKAITDYYTHEEAAVAAINAGADILLIPANIPKAYDALMEAIKKGEISEERINESVVRILRIKQERNIIK